MEDNKTLVEELRQDFKDIAEKIEILNERGVELDFEIGTRTKTVSFRKVESFGIEVTALLKQAL